MEVEYLLNHFFMQHFTIDTIQSWDRFYRGNFINCLSRFKSASLIGTVNAAGVTNLAIFSNIIHLGADPALIAFQNRPTAAAPHTIANIEVTGVYTLNHIHPSFVDKAHQTSAKYAAEESEFASVQLTEEWKPNIQAPFVAESNIKYALSLVEIVPIQHNNTFLVIGKLTDVFVDESCIESDGYLSLEKVQSVTSLGIDGYYNVSKIARYNYAKPGEMAKEI